MLHCSAALIPIPRLHIRPYDSKRAEPIKPDRTQPRGESFSSGFVQLNSDHLMLSLQPRIPYSRIFSCVTYALLNSFRDLFNLFNTTFRDDVLPTPEY